MTTRMFADDDESKTSLIADKMRVALQRLRATTDARIVVLTVCIPLSHLSDLDYWQSRLTTVCQEELEREHLLD